MSIEELEDKLSKLENLVKSLTFDKVPDIPFLCGMGGESDKYTGLPEYVHVCPAYGSDITVLYRKVTKE